MTLVLPDRIWKSCLKYVWWLGKQLQIALSQHYLYTVSSFCSQDSWLGCRKQKKTTTKKNQKCKKWPWCKNHLLIPNMHRQDFPWRGANDSAPCCVSLLLLEGNTCKLYLNLWHYDPFYENTCYLLLWKQRRSLLSKCYEHVHEIIDVNLPAF